LKIFFKLIYLIFSGSSANKNIKPSIKLLIFRISVLNVDDGHKKIDFKITSTQGKIQLFIIVLDHSRVKYHLFNSYI